MNTERLLEIDRRLTLCRDRWVEAGPLEGDESTLSDLGFAARVAYELLAEVKRLHAFLANA